MAIKTFLNAFESYNKKQRSGVRIPDSRIEKFRELNSDFYDTGKVTNKKLNVPLKTGRGKVKNTSVASQAVLEILLQEYSSTENETLKTHIRNAVLDAAGKTLLGNTANSNELRFIMRGIFPIKSIIAFAEKKLEDAAYERFLNKIDRELTEEMQTEAEEADTDTTMDTMRETNESYAMAIEDIDSLRAEESRKQAETREAEESSEMAKEDIDSPKPKPKRPKRTIVIDEPRTNPSVANVIQQAANIDFSGDSVEARVDQIEAVFDTVDTLMRTKQFTEQEIPENIRKSTKQGLEVIRTTAKDVESKKTVFQKVKGFAKTVLGFIALAPLPIPPQIKVGAGAILTGISAIEQTADAVSSIAEGSTDIQTDQIRAGIDIVKTNEQLAPAAEFAEGVVNAVEGAIEIKNTLFGEQKDKPADESTPIPAQYIENDFENVIQTESAVIDDNVESSGGIVTMEEVNDARARTINEPIDIGGQVVSPEQAVEYATHTETNSETETPSSEGMSENSEDSVPVLKGNTVTQELYENPVHPDAIGIFFGSSVLPEWDTTLLADRERRFASLPEEQLKAYLLQQNRMIFEKHGTDLLIPALMYDESSGASEIKKENHEILQLWAALKKVKSGRQSSSDTVGVKLGDLLKFRGLLTNNNGPSAPNPLDSKIPPTDQQGKAQGNPPDPPGTQPAPDTVQVSPQQAHPKDTTKNFVYTPGAVRINDVIKDEDARKAARPSLSEMVTLQGSPQLQTRSNLTRGFNHAGPSLRSMQMNQLRRSAMGTRTDTSEELKRSRALFTNSSDYNVRVRI